MTNITDAQGVNTCASVVILLPRRREVGSTDHFPVHYTLVAYTFGRQYTTLALCLSRWRRHSARSTPLCNVTFDLESSENARSKSATVLSRLYFSLYTSQLKTTKSTFGGMK